MKITIKSLHLENFKGIKVFDITFGQKTSVRGQNASGKTTLFDAVTWLLFGKNSLGVEKFSPRPLDKDGNTIHNVDIKAVATLDVDGKKVELSKVQKEKWVKKRGTDTAELQGNENLFEVDGYPKSEKDYKEYISSLVSEDLFKMLTSPTYFVSLPWKDQRNILMNFVSGISDLEIAQGNPKYVDLVSEIEKAPSLDDIKAKYQKALLEWKKRQAELPARIDEVSKMKCEVDTAELELAKKELERKICDISAKINTKSSVLEDLQGKELELQFEVNGAYSKVNDTLTHECRKCEDIISANSDCIDDANRNIERFNRLIEEKKDLIKQSEIRRDNLGKEWNEAKGISFDESKWVFDESGTVCSMCGQSLPQVDIDAKKAEFEANKATATKKFEDDKNVRLSEISTLGMKQAEIIKEYNEEISDIENKIVGYRDKIAFYKKSKAEMQEKLSALPTEPDVSNDLEYQKNFSELESVRKQIVELPTVDNSSLEQEKVDLESELDSVKSKLSLAQKNVEIDERITELETEQREIGQKVADQEKMIYLLEEFIREKMNLISESINSKFEKVNFILFQNQINGGLKETCEVMYDGVPYSTLNSGHRIVAGLDIIKALQNLYTVECMVFVDNAETINDCNIPSMDCQLITLSVSDDVELRWIM